MEDLRHAARRLRKAPGFTLVAGLTLALGIGGNAAVFSALEALLLRPLPYSDPDRLVLVQQTDGAQRSRAVAPGNFADWRERAGSFDGLAAYEVVGRTLLTEAPLRLSVGIVSGNLFDVLGVHAARGRTFGAERDGPREAVLGHDLWRSHFGGDPAVVGRDLRLDDELVRIVGVMPAGFAYPREAEIWLRAKDDLPEMSREGATDLRSLRDARYLEVVGRLRPGVPLTRAQAEMDVVAADLAASFPDANKDNGARVTPLFEELRGGARPALGLLLGAVGCVLLIACANVANLLLARAVGRRQEMAVRAALGASGRRLARQLVTEALLLAALGSGLGLALARAARPVLLALWPSSLPPLEDLRLSWPVLLFSLAVTLLCVVAVGLIPAREASRTDALASLRGASRTPFAGKGAHNARGALVVAEVALAVVLVAGAGLLLNSLWRLQRAPLGFVPEGTLTARLNLPQELGRDAGATRAVLADLQRRLGSRAGVTSVGIGQSLPLAGRRVSAGLRVDGRDVLPNDQPDVCWRVVTQAYFEALGVRVVRGRGFDGHDRAAAPAVAVVNATLARQVFPGEDPIGRRITTGLDGPAGTWVTVVGVVADTPQENVAIAARPEMYRSLDQNNRFGPTSFHVVVRAGGDPQALATALREDVTAVRSDIAVSDVVPLAGLARGAIAGPRAAGQALGLFAALALFLAALGLYGVVSCLVGERVHEMGVRLALGARPASLVALVLGRSLRLVAGGLGLGLAAALALGRLLEGTLYGVSPRDPPTLAAVTSVLLLSALAAAYAPARRAGRLDPAEVLRAE